MSIDMLNFEAVKAGIENFVNETIEKDRTNELWKNEIRGFPWNENLVDKTRPYYKIGCWQSRYQSLADATRLSVEAITAIKADWAEELAKCDATYMRNTIFLKEVGETEDYVEGIVQGLKIALDSLTSRIK